MSACKHGWASENYVKCPRCFYEARWMDEAASLRGQIRDLRRTVAFFASVIKSGEGWSEQCDRAWPVTLEPCVHDFHRAEHGVMPCTKCGAEAHADAIRALAPPATARMDAPDGPVCGCGKPSRHESGWCGECRRNAPVMCACHDDGPAMPDGRCATCLLPTNRPPATEGATKEEP